MVLLEYHGLWRSWELVYTHLAVIGEQNVGLRAPGSANLMGEYPRTGSEPEEMAGLGGRWNGGAVGAVGWACAVPRCGHMTTSAESRAALVGRVWP